MKGFFSPYNPGPISAASLEFPSLKVRPGICAEQGWMLGDVGCKMSAPRVIKGHGFLMFSLSKFQFWYFFAWGERGAKLVRSFSVDVWLGIWIEVLYLLNLKDALFPLFPSSWNPVYYRIFSPFKSWMLLGSLSPRNFWGLLSYNWVISWGAPPVVNNPG